MNEDDTTAPLPPADDDDALATILAGADEVRDELLAHCGDVDLITLFEPDLSDLLPAEDSCPCCGRPYEPVQERA